MDLRDYLYEFGFSDPETSWSYYFTHTKKYTQEEIKKIIDDITGNYKLLIALALLKDIENYNWMIKESSFEEEYDTRVKDSEYLKNNATAFSWYTEEVIQILEEIYGFKSYTLSFEASYYLNW